MSRFLLLLGVGKRGASSGPSGDAVLMESSGFMLTEGGDYVLLE
ncbi:MAG TPA: hypothetical protein VM537_29675 [Anaerolineae bacterium]|nr:hypothetical protein [Anaerolineae bacterium]